METDRELTPIAEAAERLGVHARTLMSYERMGLVKPVRRSNRRHYSEPELRWLGCVQELNREGGISLQGLSTLLRFVPCWAVRKEMEAGESGDCCAASHPAEQCLGRVHDAYAGEAPRMCHDCGIYRDNRERGRTAVAAGPRNRN
ncbi:MAG: MerR family transcriptional regulator [Gemmatimonadetes bacterium]|nr:MerR family transcriptional regulator [Gemmatimonadota bacterium]